MSSAVEKAESALEKMIQSPMNSIWEVTTTGTLREFHDFFARKLVLNGEPFGYFGLDLSRQAPDVDTMSFCTSSLLDMRQVTPSEASVILDICLRNVNSQGDILTYVDADRPRQDPVVMCNVVYLAYALGREDHPVVRHNELLLQQFLSTGGFLYGTIYYPQQESFLFHYGRIISRFKERTANYARVKKEIETAHINCMLESKPLDISKRLLLSLQFGIDNRVDLDLLLEMQNRDGSWPAQAIYTTYTTKKTHIQPFG